MKPLSSRDLRAVTNDVDSEGNRTITFTVIRSPRLGRLLCVNSDNSTEDVSVFTQNLVSPDVAVQLDRSRYLCKAGPSLLILILLESSRGAPLPRQLLIPAVLVLKLDTLW